MSESLELHTGGSQGDVEQLGLTGDDHAALASELEVGGGGAGVDLANQLARLVEDVHAVTAASVDAASGIGVDT